MGVLVLTDFVTPEGFPISQVYARILFTSYNFVSRTAVIQFGCYLSRDARLTDRQPISIPYMTDLHMMCVPSLPTMDVLYYHLKRQLRSVGLTVDDVLEEGQVPSTYSEPDPVETPPNLDPPTDTFGPSGI
jgi:hypothetical protein